MSDVLCCRLNDPCGDGCEAAFAFINSLPLNNDANVFQVRCTKCLTTSVCYVTIKFML